MLSWIICIVICLMFVVMVIGIIGCLFGGGLMFGIFSILILVSFYY